MDALVTVANLLNVTAYFVKDRLWLRTLTFAATCCLLRYFATRPDPLIEVICWNFFFATLNALVLGRLAIAKLRKVAEPWRRAQATDQGCRSPCGSQVFSST